jgi:DNA polymerase-3 subunit chi
VSEIGFYHLKTWSLERALPRLLERALADGHRIVVMAGAEERAAVLDALLWTYNDESFLPHGSARSGNVARQPVWLTALDENPNAATMLVLVDGARSDRLGEYRRICDIFDGNDEAAVGAARGRWREAQAAGHTLVYWQQSERGWEQRNAGAES